MSLVKSRPVHWLCPVTLGRGSENHVVKPPQSPEGKTSTPPVRLGVAECRRGTVCVPDYGYLWGRSVVVREGVARREGRGPIRCRRSRR